MLIKHRTTVDKLSARVENFYEQQEAKERWDQYKRERLKQVQEAALWTKTDFWCNRHGDTTGMAHKVVFGPDSGLCAYYETVGTGFPKPLLACCKGLRRRITDKAQDPYYGNSQKIIKEMREARDKGWLLQPGQQGFNAKYGDPNKKKWQQMEKEERASFEKKIMTTL